MIPSHFSITKSDSCMVRLSHIYKLEATLYCTFWVVMFSIFARRSQYWFITSGSFLVAPKPKQAFTISQLSSSLSKRHMGQRWCSLNHLFMHLRWKQCWQLKAPNMSPCLYSQRQTGQNSALVLHVGGEEGIPPFFGKHAKRSLASSKEQAVLYSVGLCNFVMAETACCFCCRGRNFGKHWSFVVTAHLTGIKK